jgi:hypothetical protein
MILATSGLQGVAIWRFLLYCDMSSTDGRLQKSPEFSADKNNNSPPDCFRQKKKGLMSPIVQLSYAGKNKQPPCPPQSIHQLNKFSKGIASREATSAQPLYARYD